MENRSRERAALVIFLALVAAGGVLLAAYFLTGRSWSVAATMVDDAAGSMESYAVVAFNGVVPPEDPPPAGASAASSASASASSSGEAAREGSSSSPGGAVDPANTMQDAFGSYGDGPTDADIGGSILSIFEREDRRQSASDGRVYVSDVRDLYSLKGADGVTLNLDDPSRYSEPVVMSAGGKKIGVFSVSSYASRAKLKSFRARLEDDGAETVLCIASRTSLISSFEGIDVVVLTTRQDESDPEGRTGSTLVVESPEVGEVGVVVLTSNNVPSYKVVKEL